MSWAGSGPLASALERANEDAHVASVARERMQPPPVATTVTKESYL